MKVCPNNALHPALDEAGLEGLWTPTLVPRIGYCEPSCVLCSEVCPTGAIWQITPKEKAGWWAWARRRISPSGSARRSTTAGAACPGRWPPMHRVRGVVPGVAQGHLCGGGRGGGCGGQDEDAEQPHVDPSRCVGCGACEYACPLQDQPAVYVTSIGESRSPSSQILLTRK